MLRILGYVWAAPYTLAAIGIGLMLSARFRFVQGVVEMHGPEVAKTLRAMPVPAAAMTMGHAVFGQNEELLAKTRRHEHVHVRQYAFFGPFFVPLYLGCSLWLFLRGRDFYRDNPFEVAAFRVDALAN